MKGLIFISAIILITSTNAQDIVKKEGLKSENGLLYLKGTDKPFTGKLATFYSNEKVESIRNIKDGLKTGKIEIFFDSGRKRVVTYEDANNINYGEVIIWNEDSTEAFNGDWTNGKLFQKGQKEPFTGKIIVKYKNSMLNEESDFKDGQWHGKQIFWNREGKKTSECIFENGKIVDCKK